MLRISRSYRRLLYLVLAVPVTLVVLALLYQAGMGYLEGKPRDFGDSVEWAAETLTTVGYGRDAHWEHPLMQAFVILTQFSGVFLIFLVVPVFLIPFLEERFEARLARYLPPMAGQVLIYRYGPAVSSLIDDLDREGVSSLVFEEDEPTARRLQARGREVVLGNLQEEDPDLRNLTGARGLVLNGDDNANASMTLSARHHGYTGPIIALVENPLRRPPMVRAGATAAFTPTHVLAAALAARASVKIRPRIAGAGVLQLGKHLDVGELRIHAESPLAGKTLGESGIRERTGATIVGLWRGGKLLIQPGLDTRLDVRSILVAVGSPAGIEALEALATPVPATGRFLVVGGTGTATKVAEFLRDAGEEVRVLDDRPGPGVDIVGDHLSKQVLTDAGAVNAQGVVVARGSDNSTLFATAVIRNLSPDTLIVAGVDRVQSLSRIHRAGADFALSIGQVASQLMAYHLLGQDAVSLEAGIKIISTGAGSFVGRPLGTHWIRERTGCKVVAVGRGEQVFVELEQTFQVEPNDVVYLCGTHEAVGKYFAMFPETRELPIAALASAPDPLHPFE